MSLILKTDVTSVKICEKLILAGIGSAVCLFEKDSSKLVQKLQCLNGQKIYGFVVSASGLQILIFGGKQFTVVEFVTQDTTTRRLFEPIVCDDWLHSAVWITEDKVALLTAHNVVQIWSTFTRSLLSKHCSKDNSILYSGLVLSLHGEVLVLAGTVFSEVILHVSGEDKPLYRLVGHKGVIFSISCDTSRGIIVTTSDDRSIRIWGPNNTLDHPPNCMKYWRYAHIVCKYELYGHTARVMRSCIGSDKIISVGEDAAICFWNLDGSLEKKIVSHQNSSIWAVDADDDVLVTGGSDGAIITHPITVATDYCSNETLDIGIGTPKKLIYTARTNLVIVNEDDELIYYNVDDKKKTVLKLNHESTYKLMSLSTCKQMIAVADMNGKLDVFAETCKDSAYLINIIDMKLPVNKILSMQWAGNRFLVLCLDKGTVLVLASKESSSDTYAEFVLPNCKERWLTAAAVDNSKNVFVLGDRCGNIHVYYKGQKDPVKSFSKVHGRYGPTSITMNNDTMITTGRNGTVNYFSLDNKKAKLMCSKDLEFKWIEKFLDKEQNIVCGFQERVFVVYNIKTNSKMLEVACGGGHRSWDAVRYFKKVHEEYKEFIKLLYLKNSDINMVTFQLDKILSRNIISGTHSKEINCLKTHQHHYDGKSGIFVISGGEDTTLRISSINTEFMYEDLAIFKQLSSIRTLKTFWLSKDKYLVMSAGGRAQICIKIVSFSQTDKEIKVKTEELIDYMIKGTDRERKGNQNWRNCTVDFDPETRIMDINLFQTENNNFKIFAGCSDAILRVYSLSYNEQISFDLVTELKYHKTCILKTTCINFFSKNILITCSTRGEVVFWDVTNITNELEPFFVTKTNKSGINSFAYKAVSDEILLIATGGDDNAMHLVLLQFSDHSKKDHESFVDSKKLDQTESSDSTGQFSNQSNKICVKVLDSKVFDKHHSSEITGLCLMEDYVLSTSIDQRITLYECQVKADAIQCTFLSQTYSDVADIQGMDVISCVGSSIRVCVFGKGLEILDVPVSSEDMRN